MVRWNSAQRPTTSAVTAMSFSFVGNFSNSVVPVARVVPHRPSQFHDDVELTVEHTVAPSPQAAEPFVLNSWRVAGAVQ